MGVAIQTDQKLHIVDTSDEKAAELINHPPLVSCLSSCLRRLYNVKELPTECTRPASNLDFERITPYVQTLVTGGVVTTLADFEEIHLGLLTQILQTNKISVSPAIMESIVRIMNTEQYYGEILEYMILFEQQCLSQGPRFLRYTAEMLCEVYQSTTFEQLNDWSDKDFRVRLLIPRIKLIAEA